MTKRRYGLHSVEDDEWRPIFGFDGWSISPQGNVKNETTGRVLTTRLNRQGFRMVNLLQDNKLRTRSVARIVAESYLEDPRNEAYNSLIHLDGNRGNCSVDNIVWRPRWYAVRYHQMFDREPYKLSVYIEETEEIFDTLREACMVYGLVELYTYVDMLNDIPCFHHRFHFHRFEE